MTLLLQQPLLSLHLARLSLKSGFSARSASAAFLNHHLPRVWSRSRQTMARGSRHNCPRQLFYVSRKRSDRQPCCNPNFWKKAGRDILRACATKSLRVARSSRRQRLHAVVVLLQRPRERCTRRCGQAGLAKGPAAPLKRLGRQEGARHRGARVRGSGTEREGPARDVRRRWAAGPPERSCINDPGRNDNMSSRAPECQIASEEEDELVHGGDRGKGRAEA